MFTRQKTDKVYVAIFDTFRLAFCLTMCMVCQVWCSWDQNSVMPKLIQSCVVERPLYTTYLSRYQPRQAESDPDGCIVWVNQAVVVNASMVAQPDGDVDILVRPVNGLEDVDRF